MANSIESTDALHKPPSTVGRGKAVTLSTAPITNHWSDGSVQAYFGDSLDHYEKWETPMVIISDGAYGVLGFEGDTHDHADIANWYEPHIARWSAAATPQTTLWFWNSEIGWAAVHPVLEKLGWDYVNANIWNKGVAHIAGNINTAKIRRFPVVTEICVQYVFRAQISGLSLQQWLINEWKRTGLPIRLANEACGVKDAAGRKYLDKGHLWYFPPPEMFHKLATFANENGCQAGRPYFSIDGSRSLTAEEWQRMRAKFYCPVGYTNVWDRNPLKGSERVKVKSISGKAAHLNQKPLDLMRMIIEASSDLGDVVWEPFGGLMSASVAARDVDRKSFACEIDSTYFQLAIKRLETPSTKRLF